MEARAEEVPVQYTPDEWNDLVGYLRPHAEDVDGSLAAWTKSFVIGDQDQTIDMLHGCWPRFATNSVTARGKRKEPKRPLKLFAGNPAPAATTLGS